MPKQRKPVKLGENERHSPLGNILVEDDYKKKYASTRMPRGRVNWRKDDEEELLDEKTSRKILSMSQLQREEEEQREAQIQSAQQQAMADDSSDEEDDDHEHDEEDDEDVVLRHDDQGYISVDGPGLSEAEERLVSSMSGPNNVNERRNLADIILAKIHEKEEQHERGGTDGGGDEPELPPKVVEVYTDIGRILSRYTAGKLPKAFKVIPSLSNWEDILFLTRPDQWTPHAMYAATRIFASNLNPKMAQRFYHLVLLDAVRADIEANHKLHYHYYMSLKKAVYKPAAFFKGILLPLCNENCTLREAAIVASVMQKVSIPAHHSAVAIHKLSQLEYTGAASIFIKTLLNKKYSLPAPVIGSLVTHFSRFVDDPRQLPVLWHQCLLVFVQRYKNEVKDEAREALRLVMKAQFHPKITPEIRRELYGAQAFHEEREKIQQDAMVTN